MSSLLRAATRTTTKSSTTTLSKHPKFHALPTKPTTFRSLSRSTPNLNSPNTPPSKTNTSTPNPSNIPSFNLWVQVRASSCPVRYTIYTGFFLAATAETSFWANAIYAKYFAGEEDRESADAFLERFSEVARGYRVRWMVNYRNYWGANMWGL